ncbi:hypothetical protein ZYGR_0I05630 [Zygosaccharomyces rouxii]|uniref:DnaJ homologue subfamily C member 28 conserved domain-containing protein n=1 Tax=Zygosaccharomyces rouxii TaxID=4956 RepID=A0A1Q2ZXQ6_ZYGRO|nr:hypothetical protein ZYGR_0I05630 [Zygosaccharomyces rouxii]
MIIRESCLMRPFTRIVSRRRLNNIRYYSSKDDDSYLMRRLQDLKDQSTVDKNDPLVKLSQFCENDVGNEWAYEEDKINADKILEIINAQQRVSNMHLGSSSDEDGQKASRPPSASDSEAQREAFQFINKMPGHTFQDKIETAQKRAIRYKLRQEKIQEARDQKEQSHFRELYAERFTPIGSFEKLESLADRRIEESMRQGGFEDVGKVRGKPTELPRPNQHVSTTEHYLNNILVKQNIAPPWIENQSRVNRNVTDFRAELFGEFERELSSILKKFKLFNSSSNVETVRRSIAHSYGSVDGFLKYRFENWKNSRKTWADRKISTINSGLRTYNLQAPLSTQKLYLVSDKEFQRVLDNINFDNLIDSEITSSKNKQAEERHTAQSKSPSLGAFFKLW